MEAYQQITFSFVGLSCSRHNKAILDGSGQSSPSQSTMTNPDTDCSLFRKPKVPVKITTIKQRLSCPENSRVKENRVLYACVFKKAYSRVKVAVCSQCPIIIGIPPSF